VLKITISGAELFDEESNTFTNVTDTTLELEHSLVSMSKWESIHQKPFLSAGRMSTEEVLDYVRAMIVTPDFPSDVISRLNDGDLAKINDYIDSAQSATTFVNTKQTSGRGEVITSEMIYYWMVAFSIPFECETWHLNRLFALIRICNIKNSKDKKMSRRELADRNRELNAQRKAKLGTTG
jgi:hypothetical protein